MLARGAVVAPQACDGTDRPKVQDKNAMDRGEFMTKLLEEASNWMHNDLDSLTLERVASEPVLERPVFRSELRDMIEDARSQLIKKLNMQVAQATEKSYIGIVENIVDVHNTSLVWTRWKEPPVVRWCHWWMLEKTVKPLKVL